MATETAAEVHWRIPRGRFKGRRVAAAQGVGPSAGRFRPLSLAEGTSPSAFKAPAGALVDYRWTPNAER